MHEPGCLIVGAANGYHDAEGDCTSHPFIVSFPITLPKKSIIPACLFILPEVGLLLHRPDSGLRPPVLIDSGA